MTVGELQIAVVLYGFLCSFLCTTFALKGFWPRYLGGLTVFWLAMLYIGVQINMTDVRDLNKRIAALEKPVAEQKQ